MSSIVDGSLAVAGILTAMMVSALILKGSEASDLPVLGYAGKESVPTKKAA